MKKILKTLLILCLLLSVKSFAFAEETLIIFDASVSMNETFMGKPKYIVAVEEAQKILSTFPSNKRVGLRTIGIKLNAGALAYIQNPESMCRATELEVPININSQNKINEALNDVFPLGTTPLEYSLRQSVANDFSQGSHLKHIIIITDGAENCDGDPCRYITELSRTRKDIKIDVVALSVNAEDYNVLKCLTDKTNGRVYNVNDTNELQNAYRNILKDSPADTIHSPVTPSINNQLYPALNNELNDSNIKYKNYLYEFSD